MFTELLLLIDLWFVLLLFCLLVLIVCVGCMLIFCIICVTICFGCLIRYRFANLSLFVFYAGFFCCLLVKCRICFSYFIGLLRVSLLLLTFLCRLLFFCVFGFCWCLIVLVWFIVWFLLFGLIWSDCWIVIMNASLVWCMLLNSVAIRFIIIGIVY